MIRRSLLLVLIFCAVLPTVSALMIHPPKIFVDYNPGAVVPFFIDVANDAGSSIVVQTQYEGVYTDNVQLLYPEKHQQFVLDVGESQRVEFQVTMPTLEQFGENRFMLIRFYQVPYDDNNPVGATLAMLVPLDTYVPYPSKYVVISLPDQGITRQGETAPLTATVTSAGSRVIDSFTGYFTVSGSSFSKDITVDPITLFVPGNTRNVTASFDTTGVPSGFTNVTFTAVYDGESHTSLPARLIIGTKDVDIRDVTPKEFTQGRTSFAITVHNIWIEDLSPALSVSLLDNTSTAVQSTSVGIYTLPAGQQKEIYTTLDLSSVASGEYTLRVLLTLDGVEKNKDFKVEISSPVVIEAAADTGTGTVAVIVVLTIVLVIVSVLILVLVVAWRKRDE